MPIARAALVLVLAVIAAAPAHAQGPLPAPPPTPAAPDERGAAREFSFAAYRLRVALVAQRADIEQRMQAGLDAFDQPACEDALVEIVLLPEGRRDEALVVAAALALAPAFAAVRPAFERFLGEIERVPTADPALRTGRADWRASIGALRRFPAEIDVCGTLERWRRANFARAATPLGLGEDLAGALPRTRSAKLARAARRMRQLGVSPGAARRFSGETLFRGIGDDLDLPG